MHVSPFMEMDVDYDWRFVLARRATDRAYGKYRDGNKIFDATLDLERVEISATALAGALACHPFMTGKVMFAIHWQALKLWLKGAPVHDHPRHHATNDA